MVKQKEQKQTPRLQPAPPLQISSDLARYVRDLFMDLSSRWERYGPTFEATWRSFNGDERSRVMEENDTTELDDYYVPEWNADDIAAKPEFLLDIIRYRATARLSEQCHKGSANNPSDFDFAARRMRESGIGPFPTGIKAYTIFQDGDEYGEAYIAINQKIAASFLLPRDKAHLCVPQTSGELVLGRQGHILQALNSMVKYTWERDPKEQARQLKATQSTETAALLLQLIHLSDDATDESASDNVTAKVVLDTARHHKKSLDRHWNLLGVEAGMLANKVEEWFTTQPGLIPDKQGQKLPVNTGKYLSPCLFDFVHDLAKNNVFWAYIVALLLELQGLEQDDTPGRNLILQEMAHVCHLAFQRAQSVFKRHIQRYTGRSWFERVCDECDNDGNPLVILTLNLDDLNDTETLIHPGLLQILQLCRPETTVDRALDWAKMLNNLWTTKPDEKLRIGLYAAEAEVLGELATLLSFIRDLTEAISLPPVTGKKRVKGLFVSKSHRLDKDLCALKDKLDLTMFTVPLMRLFKPNVAAGALEALDNFYKDKTGAGVLEAYNKVVEGSISELQSRCAQAKAKRLKENGPVSSSPSVPIGRDLFIEITPQKGDKAQGRKEKVKTRPPEGTNGSILPDDAPPPPPPAASRKPKIKVSADTAVVFDVLFDRTQNRRPIAFSDLESAMVELGFAVNSQSGSSSTTFTPPQESDWLPICVHRPHGTATKFEGYDVLRLSSRFKNHFGWDSETFEVA
ncbi:uncharacterized protein ColSpa_07917 [Colletotrichum spaethianum]|uniref:Ipa protein n=1 Tax=Colletotrichum spaethianum TaxID=700344 RepID=A0AA37P8R9_9PEZI|nr:uncharacterized protein ColSpa_07917 [Colletotrichum spaethianum]GKT47736.1 hypothetical protein ColSpa_07917 [Colletotrichum spaethianum]